MVCGFDHIVDGWIVSTRMVQRFGRTGRKRSGRIVVLMTEDDKRKQKWLLQRVKNKESSNPRKFLLHVLQHNPLMLPKDVQPECIEKSMEISIFSHLKLGSNEKKEK